MEEGRWPATRPRDGTLASRDRRSAPPGTCEDRPRSCERRITARRDFVGTGGAVHRQTIQDQPNTLRNYQTTERLPTDHFVPSRPVSAIHAGHARDYKEWLVGKYAPATVAREIKRARQFFEYAKDHHLTADNPFAKIKAGSQKNTKRKHFVDREVIEKVFAACPDNNWRLLIALARYGGLRIPSELQQLTWGDIDWHSGKCTVRVPKKEHIDGHETRIVPIFPEIMPYLQHAFDEAPEGCVYVLPRRFHSEGYDYAGVLRAVERASLAEAPRQPPGQ